MHELLGPNRRNGIAVAAVVAVLAAAYGPFPGSSAEYAAWLVVFWIWMAWFVATFVVWLADADF